MSPVLSINDDVASRSARGGSADEYVCWSRMQAEAGQGLQAIVRRKELERRAGEGMFCWGVGNAPSAIVGSLARLRQPVPAIFSVMRSRPKAADVRPTRTVVWRRFVDVDGSVRPLPSHVLITSRGDSASGPKTKHFALMCWSDKALELRHGQPFDPSAYRNAGGAGAPVGSSQVTALLRRTSRGSKETHYEVNLKAWLTGGYWVQLVDPVECSPQFEKVDLMGGSVREWVEFVAQARGFSAERSAAQPAQGMLF